MTPPRSTHAYLPCLWVCSLVAAGCSAATERPALAEDLYTETSATIAYVVGGATSLGWQTLVGLGAPVAGGAALVWAIADDVRWRQEQRSLYARVSPTMNLIEMIAMLRLSRTEDSPRAYSGATRKLRNGIHRASARNDREHFRYAAQGDDLPKSLKRLADGIPNAAGHVAESEQLTAAGLQTLSVDALKARLYQRLFARLQRSGDEAGWEAIRSVWTALSGAEAVLHVVNALRHFGVEPGQASFSAASTHELALRLIHYLNVDYPPGLDPGFGLTEQELQTMSSTVYQIVWEKPSGTTNEPEAAADAAGANDGNGGGHPCDALLGKGAQHKVIISWLIKRINRDAGRRSNAREGREEFESRMREIAESNRFQDAHPIVSRRMNQQRNGSPWKPFSPKWLYDSRHDTRTVAEGGWSAVRDALHTWCKQEYDANREDFPLHTAMPRRL